MDEESSVDIPLKSCLGRGKTICATAFAGGLHFFNSVCEIIFHGFYSHQLCAPEGYAFPVLISQ